jgi:fermentation-respiration switch protein FrsA (DUF1100 family)
MELDRIPKLVPLTCLLVILVSPPVRGLVKGALLVPEVVPSPLHPLSGLLPRPQRREVHLATGDADWYRPRGHAVAPGVVLVHGADPAGKDDARIVGLAEALAREGRQVLVPQLGLREQRFDAADPLRIRGAVSYLAGRSHGRVGVLAFSYGAGLTLVALAEQPAVQHRTAFVATVGTYFSLFDLLQGATTHTVPYRGRAVAWQPDPSALDLAAGQLAAFLGGADGHALTAAWGRRDPTGLGPGPAAVYELLANDDPARFDALAGRLPPELLALLNSLSPAHSVGRLDVPVLALHARSDPASPPTESRLLVDALRGRVRTSLSVVGNLSHVSPAASIAGDVSDAFRMAAFAGAALELQEGWPRF